MMTTGFNPFRNLVLAVVASTTVLGFAAAPAEAAEVRAASIAVDRLELSRADGRLSVERRVVAAAQQLCGDGGVDWKNINEAAAYKLCVANAVRDARLQMAAIANRSQLAELR